LPVFESGDDVFGAGADATVRPVVVIVEDPAVGCSARAGDGVDATVSTVAEDDTAMNSCATVWRATMTSLRLAGRQRPTATTVRRCTPMTMWVLTLRR